MMLGLNDVLNYSIAYGMGEEEGRAKAEKEKKKESPWHTGTPTEEGWYLLNLKKDYKPYCVAYMDGRHWLGINDFFILVDDVKAWQKIKED